MSDTQPTPPPAVTWRRRALRRTAGSLGAAVVLAAVGPALANAAGADVANPVAIALRASGEGLQEALTGGDEPEETAAPCVTPPAEPVEPSVEPVEPSAEPVEPSAEPSLEPVDPVSPDPDAPVSPEPTEAVEPAEPAGDPVEGADDCAAPVATPEPTEAAAETTAETEEADDAEGEHGQVVSTVARCAPKGKDRLLDVDGAPANHGGYVKAAAHGDTLTLPWGTYDLATQAGADELCASLAAARAALPEEPVAEKGRGAAKDKRDGERGRPDKAAKKDGATMRGEHGKPGHAGGGKGRKQR